MRPSLSLFAPRAVPHMLRPTAGPSIAAFALVRRVLETRPHQFRELLAEGIRSEAGEQEVAKKGQQGQGPNANPFKVVAAAKTARKSNTLLPMDVPAGHPFVSATFLKKRIIPALAGLELIERKWNAPYPNTGLARYSPDRKHVMWQLSSAPKAAERWEEVLRSASTRTQRAIGAAIQEEKRAAAAAAHEAAIAAGEVERTPREIAAWADRPKGMTTHLERTHLNRRRARARTEKEERRAELDAERRAALAAAREAVGA